MCHDAQRSEDMTRSQRISPLSPEARRMVQGSAGEAAAISVMSDRTGMEVDLQLGPVGSFCRIDVGPRDVYSFDLPPWCARRRARQGLSVSAP